MPGPNAITVEATITAPIAIVWGSWTSPEHIKQWCSASDDWEVPYADNDVRPGGKFKTTMAAKDRSFQFDFEGVYSRVEPETLIEYAMPDGREVSVRFDATSDGVRVVETFDPETQNPIEMQQAGWQAILDHFKRYTESL
ncbi:polyketide cyclase [bacterium]|nr:polyketide cyclase [bacterium]